ATGSYDNTVRIWDAETGQELHVFEGHTAAVHRVSFSHDGRYIASGGDDQTVRLWDVETGTGSVVHTHAAQVWAVAFAPDRAALASADVAGFAVLHHITSASGAKAITHEELPHVGSCSALAFAPNGKQLAFACDAGEVHVWDFGKKRMRVLTADPG